jgi:hypothetical protein
MTTEPSPVDAARRDRFAAAPSVGSTVEAMEPIGISLAPL